jgi:hypothetical protein
VRRERDQNSNSKSNFSLDQDKSKIRSPYKLKVCNQPKPNNSNIIIFTLINFAIIFDRRYHHRKKKLFPPKSQKEKTFFCHVITRDKFIYELIHRQ